MINPLAKLRDECQSLIEKAIIELSPGVNAPSCRLAQPPDPKMGELSSSISFQLASILRLKPVDIAESIASKISTTTSNLVASVEAMNGYVNFRANMGSFSRLVLEAASDEDYGFLKTKSPERVMVEHTSANPVHPLTIGTARNAILGGCIAEMQRRLGHAVEIHFYVDDMGRQVAMATYGWRLIGRPEPVGRPDKWFGEVYASVNVLKEVKRLKEELRHIEAEGDDARVREINQELGKYAAAAKDLVDRNASVFDALQEKIEADENPDASIMRLNTEYERGQAEAKEDVRNLVRHCVKGFERTLGEIGISFDEWDYEGDLVWSRAVEEAMDALRATPHASYEEGALVLDCDAVARDMNLKERWGMSPAFEVPRLVLIRADGTTLYTPRDVAYSLWKFQRVDRVINVIGNEQSLAQLQLKIALAALGKIDLADRQTHFAYGLVKLADQKMSGRLGRYVTLNEVLERSVSLAYDEVEKRSIDLPEEQKQEIAKTVGHGAVKYALLSVDPMKVVVFDWGKALNFEMNSAPFIQYSHARACNIMKRAGRRPEPDYALLEDNKERELVMMAAQFPEVFENAAKELKPADVTAYANTLADRFNSFYAALPVIKAEPRGLAGARLMLVDAVRVVLSNALSVLGIDAPERM